LQSDPVLIRPKLASVLIQYWSVLISVTQLYKKNQTRISGHRQRSIENPCFQLILQNTDFLDWK